MIGAAANVSANNFDFATAIGAGAVVGSSNSVVLGRSADTVRVPGALNLTGTFDGNTVNATNVNTTNLNLTGTFAANIVNSVQYNIGGNRVLSVPGQANLFVGVDAGSSNTTGFNNSFVGPSAGAANTTGDDNSFFGIGAGQANTSAGANSFFGASAGTLNTTGTSNSFFGSVAGNKNTTGSGNSFFGIGAGASNTTGANNTFLGSGTGSPNLATKVNNSTAIGFGAKVSTNNTIVLGTSTENTVIPGKLAAGASGGVVAGGGGYLETFDVNGISGIFTGNLVFFGIDGILPSPVHLCIRTTSLGATGGEALSRCTSSSSSVNNKTEVQPFAGGLDLINRLKPVAFKWKGGGSDFGLNAEEVAEVEPLFVTRNDKGEVEDVKEGSLNVLFINAFKEQQAQIKEQQGEIETLKKRQQEFDSLKALLCADHPNADVCR